MCKGNRLESLDSSDGYGNEIDQQLTSFRQASSRVPFILTQFPPTSRTKHYYPQHSRNKTNTKSKNNRSDQEQPERTKSN